MPGLKCFLLNSEPERQSPPLHPRQEPRRQQRPQPDDIPQRARRRIRKMGLPRRRRLLPVGKLPPLHPALGALRSQRFEATARLDSAGSLRCERVLIRWRPPGRIPFDVSQPLLRVRHKAVRSSRPEAYPRSQQREARRVREHAGHD